jgi:hypothetical protein
MGDAPTQRQSSHDSFRGSYSPQDDTNNGKTNDALIDTSPHSLANIHAGQKPVSSMEFEGYPHPQFPGSGPSGGHALDMRSMASALPDYNARSYPQQSFQMGMAGGQPHGIMYQVHPGVQFAGQAGSPLTASSPSSYAQHYSSSQSQRPGAYSGMVHAPGMTGQPQSFQNTGYQGMVHGIRGHPHAQQHLHPQLSPNYGSGYANRGYHQPLRVSPTNSSMYQSSAQHSKLTSKKT